jgi:hypothetical protein
MPRRASDRFVLAAFALLAAGSLALKAAAGPPRDGLMDVSTDRFDGAVSGILLRQQFALAERTHTHRSKLIVASRGACQIGVRDARDGAAVATAFAADADGIGTVRYLYRGHSYDQPPSFAMRLGRIQTEVMSRLGMARRAPMPVALAVSPACGTSDFGLADVRI